MTRLSRILIGAVLGVGLGWFAAAGQARASVTVLGSNFAHDCFVAAKYGGPNGYGLEICSRSIDNEALDRRDLAGTFVNRGVIYMEQGAFKSAEHDFNRALALLPNLGEAVVNLGGAMIGEHRYAEGVAQITRGLALSPEEPEKAFYNRALGYEGLDDMKSAYFDYLKASQIKPGWGPAKTELTRFTVTQKAP
ncbi:MAG TPA: tetratricopeptide repeat protein [Caulobacteraceae bacterium]|jgi:tetratricopeptide (TPR) repeat protein